MSTTLTIPPHQTPTTQDIKRSHTNSALSIQESVHTPQIQTPTSTPPPPPSFPLLSLPPELLHQIAIEYYTLLPPLTITANNLHLPLHDLTPLSLALSHLNHSNSNSSSTSILPPTLYYIHTTFLFSTPSLLRPFSTLFNRSEKVRKIEIWYGAVGPLGPGRGREDWVFKLLSCFKGLEEVGFVVEAGIGRGEEEGEGCDKEMHRRVVGAWWECVRDAVREGVCTGTDSGMAGRGKRKGLVLSVECDGLEGWRERIGGCEVK